MNAVETGSEPIDQDKLTRAQKAMLALSNEVATQLAEDHGVCVRPLAMIVPRGVVEFGSASGQSQ